jgi:hypothetical protein
MLRPAAGFVLAMIITVSYVIVRSLGESAFQPATNLPQSIAAPRPPDVTPRLIPAPVTVTTSAPRLEQWTAPRPAPELDVPRRSVASNAELNRPDNGQAWRAPNGERGVGTLQVRNANPEDGVAILFRAARAQDTDPILAVYVRGREDTTVEGIAPGTYRLRFMLGRDWDDTTRRFRSALQCEAFVDLLEFCEYDTSEPDGVVHHWTSQTVTLHPVLAGTARTTQADPALLRFDALPTAR